MATRERPGEAGERRETRPAAARDPGDAVPPGVAGGDDREEGRRGAERDPGGALEALTATFEGPELLEAWQGGLVLLAYGLAAAFLGTLLAVRRDVV